VATTTDATAKPTGTVSKPTTRKHVLEDAPETEEDILERMIILSNPKEAK
jgi:hypothetical protein